MYFIFQGSIIFAVIASKPMDAERISRLDAWGHCGATPYGCGQWLLLGPRDSPMRVRVKARCVPASLQTRGRPALSH
jgi:hypothetical protein